MRRSCINQWAYEGPCSFRASRWRSSAMKFQRNTPCSPPGGGRFIDDIDEPANARTGMVECHNMPAASSITITSVVVTDKRRRCGHCWARRVAYATAASVGSGKHLVMLALRGHASPSNRMSGAGAEYGCYASLPRSWSHHAIKRRRTEYARALADVVDTGSGIISITASFIFK